MTAKRPFLSARSAFRLVLIAAAGLTTLAAAKAEEGTYAQRALCTADAFRVCGSEIPDVDAVKSCMIANKSQLSQACRSTFPKETASR
jgi:hypothetical protein